MKPMDAAAAPMMAMAIAEIIPTLPLSLVAIIEPSIDKTSDKPRPSMGGVRFLSYCLLLLWYACY